MQKPRRFGKYLLIDRISSGGMAEVYLAKSVGVQGFEKILAIKRILPAVSEDPDFETMFIDEAKISARLSHSNVGQVFEFGQVAGQYYIAMEYISGRDLRAIQTHLAETDRVMDVSMALHIAARVCQALDYAHRLREPDGVEMEIVHRDISPPNVIISYDGAVKLIDFGIAKATSRATRTRAGKLKGKFSYMSPEQVQGKPIDHRSDIFSLGTVMHELFTNRRLFHGETQLETMHQVRRAEVDPPSTINPDVPLEVDTIVLKALARDRDQRYGWASELRADIERYFARNSLLFETSHLSKWMQTEFAGDVEAERRLKERVRGFKAEQVDDAPGAAPGTAPGTAPGAAPGVDDAREEAPTVASDPAPELVQASRGADDATRPVAVREQAQTQAQQGAGLADEDLPPLVGQAREPEEDATEAYAPGLRFTEPPQGDDASLPPTDPTERSAGAPPPGTPHPGIGGTDGTFPDAVPPAAGDELTDEHEMEVPLPSPAADAGRPRTGRQPPRVLGPAEQKQRDQALVDWPTALSADASGEQLAPTPLPPGEQRVELEDQPTTIEPEAIIKARHTGAIAPGPDRESGVVGGALEVDSDPSKQVRITPSGVDVEGISGVVRTSEVPLAAGGQVSGTQELSEQHQKPRFTSLQVMVLAGGITLLVAALVTLVILITDNGEQPTGPGRRPTGPSGSIIVTARPHAACTVSLDDRPKGLLSPGASLSIPGTPVGQHQIAVTCVGFRPYATSIEVKQAKVTFVEALLKRE